MRRDQFEQLLRELARVSGKREVVVVGSQSIYGSIAKVPGEVVMSVEVDILVDGDDPQQRPITELLGKSSTYQAEHRVYVDPVPASFPYLPPGWETRLRELDLGDLVARCLEIYDLVLSKLAAGRLKDNELIVALISNRHVDAATVSQRIEATPDPHLRAVLLARLQLVLENVGR